MNQNVKVSVSKEPLKESAVSCKRVPIGLRLFHKLFGDKEKMTVIILGKQVGSITITEEERKG